MSKIKKRVLLLSNFLPFKETKYIAAGYNVTLKIIDDLASDGYRIDFLGLVNNENMDEIKFYKNASINNIYVFNITKLKKIVNIFKNLTKPILCSVRFDERIIKKLNEIKKDYDIIFIDYTQNIGYIEYLENTKAKKIIFEQDVAYQSFERKYKTEKNIVKKICYYLEYYRLKKYEKKLIKKYDCVIVPSVKDYDLIKNEARKMSILQPFFNKIIRNKNKSNTLNIGFFGAMNRKENEEAVLWFLENIWESIVTDNIYFYIIGANPGDKLKKKIKMYKNIYLTGYIDDLTEYFSVLDIGVIPLFKGAGIKIKTLEMLYAEIPCVSTLIGIEGINVEPDVDILLSTTTEEFIHNLNRLITDHTLRNKISENLKNNKSNLFNGLEINEIFKNVNKE